MDSTPDTPLIIEQPKLPTPAEMRKLRKQFVTVQYGKIPSCGHSYNPEGYPRHKNCDSCWFVFFQNHGELVQQCDEMFQADGGAMIEQVQGKKFLHRWRQFMATVAQWQKVGEINGVS